MNSTIVKVSIYLLPIVLSTLLSSLTVAHAEANTTLSPYFFIKDKETSLDQFPLKDTQVHVTINGVIANVEVTQEYANMGSEPISGSYIFPASTRAAVHGMSMVVNEEVVIARIKEKEQAQKSFKKAKSKGKSASLLQQQRPNVFSMDVANIMPGDTIKITLQYTELLVPTDMTYQFVYPTVVGPRYSGQLAETAPVSDQWVNNPYLEPGEDPMTSFSIQVDITSALDIRKLVCTSHEIKTNWEGKSAASITLPPNSPFGGDRDFILNYKLAGDSIQTGMMLYEHESEKFFLMVIEPPEKIEQEQIPDREYIFIVDVSGSMNGFPLDTSKELLRDLIGNLRVNDTFNVILFAGSSTLMAPRSLPATKENINKAIQVIDRARGGGGTELSSALKRGLSLPVNEKVSRTIMVISDGYISAEKDVFQLIRTNLNTTNFFAFGIGSSVNRYLIDGIAKAGNGEPFVVTKPEEAARTAEKFRFYLQSPLLTNISVNYDGFEAYDTEPAIISDLFAQRPLVITGKYHGEPKGNISISGASGKGDFLHKIKVSGENLDDTNGVLPYLWARKRLMELSDFNFNDTAEEIRAEIVNLGLTYNLLSKYTSFVAVHEQIRNPSAESKNVKQPLTLPKNVSRLAVSAPVRKVPEPGFFLVALLIFLLVFISYRRKIYINS